MIHRSTIQRINTTSTRHTEAKLLQKGLRKLAKWCAKWRIKLNPEKTKVIIFSRSYLATKSEPPLKLYGERLKIYPQVKFLGITFDSKFTFKKQFEDILGRCNARYNRIRLLTNKKWGPSPSTILQIYKQCVRPIFEYGSLSTITTSDTIISEIQRLQNKFIRLALRVPKYISVKLLHDSSGLPYVKDRLFSRATKTSERISADPLVEESISYNKVNPAWDRFLTPLSIVRPVSLWITRAYRDGSRTKSARTKPPGKNPPRTKSPWTKPPEQNPSHYILYTVFPCHPNSKHFLNESVPRSV